MDPLEYFDEEYKRFNDNVSSINSLMLESRDHYLKLIEIQKSMQVLFSKNDITSENLKTFLSLLEDLMRNSKELLSVIESSYNIIDDLRYK